MIFDPLYLIMLLPAILLSVWASWRVKHNFNKYSKVRNARNVTGAQAADELLRSAGINDVKIVRSQGLLSDHYNPATKKLALSSGVYDSPSVAAVGIAAHEAGHAIQHAQNYAPLWVRSLLVPTASIGSNLGYFVMIIGLFTGMMGLFWLGVLMFGAVLLFQVVTLPVEFDASARAKRLVTEHGIIMPGEREGIDKVLNAAAWTYVAAVVSTALTLLYFLLRAGVVGGRD